MSLTRILLPPLGDRLVVWSDSVSVTREGEGGEVEDRSVLLMVFLLAASSQVDKKDKQLEGIPRTD